MRILIEGPDGSGKTTLSKILINKGYHYIHSAKPDCSIDEYTKKEISNLISHTNIVMDRGVISNIVYSSVFNDTDMVSSDLFYEELSLIDVIVLAIPFDKEEYLNKFNKLKNRRDEEYGCMENIYDEFRTQRLFKDVLLNKKVVYYDMNLIKKENVMTFVEKEILNVD